MSEDEFRHSTLRYVYERIDNYKDEQEEEHKKLEYMSWLIGRYVIPAVSVVLDTKHRVKYPDNPVIEKEVVVEDMELTEDEKDQYAEHWMKKLVAMQNKNERAKKIQGG